MTDEECMKDVVCKNPSYAGTYLWTALPFIRGDLDRALDGFEWPTWALDTSSIMIYGSYFFSSDPNADWPTGAVLHGVDRGTGDRFEFYQGGQRDPAKRIPSGRDGGRVAQLYPRGIQYGQA
ncbi:hypothetical protein LTR27_005318 [Elasticomyces elasticus]|nr:hypothetical protein LTR27_005318 [Elasticomyces elasticus]